MYLPSPCYAFSQTWRLPSGRVGSVVFMIRLASSGALSPESGSATRAATVPEATSYSTSCAQGTTRWRPREKLSLNVNSW